jgi:hypothetical protein
MKGETDRVPREMEHEVGKVGGEARACSTPGLGRAEFAGIEVGTEVGKVGNGSEDSETRADFGSRHRGSKSAPKSAVVSAGISRAGDIAADFADFESLPERESLCDRGPSACDPLEADLVRVGDERDIRRLFRLSRAAPMMLADIAFEGRRCWASTCDPLTLALIELLRRAGGHDTIVRAVAQAPTGCPAPFFRKRVPNTAVTLTRRRPMKSRLAASEMYAMPKPCVPHSLWVHVNRPAVKCRCSTSTS